MNFFRQVKELIGRFFLGRYGGDSLNIFLLFISLILLNIPYVMILSYIILGYVIFRALSKNIHKRRNELNYYNNKIGRHINAFSYKAVLFFKAIFLKVKKEYGLIKRKRTEKNQYVFFRCKECGNTLRVPKNKGKIKITCPVCKASVEKIT